MTILIFAVILGFLLNFKTALIYFAIASGITLFMVWGSAYSSTGIASDGSSEDKKYVFKKLLTLAFFARPWWPIDFLAIGVSLAYYFYNK